MLSAVIDRLAYFKYTDLVQGNQTALLSELKDVAMQKADNPDKYLNRTSTQLAKALKTGADKCELSSGPGALAASVVGADGGQLGSAGERKLDLTVPISLALTPPSFDVMSRSQADCDRLLRLS